MFEYWYKYHEPKSKGVVLSYSISAISFKVKCKLGTTTPGSWGGVVIESDHVYSNTPWTLNILKAQVMEVSMVQIRFSFSQKG